MKNCVNCGQNIPGEAMHCGHCGSKQPASAPQQAPGGPQNKTIMGYAAADLLKELKQGGDPGPAGAPYLGPGSAPPPGGQPGNVPAHAAKTIAVSAPANLPPLGGPPPSAPSLGAGGAGPPPPMPYPGGASPPGMPHAGAASGMPGAPLPSMQPMGGITPSGPLPAVPPLGGGPMPYMPPGMPNNPAYQGNPGMPPMGPGYPGAPPAGPGFHPGAPPPAGPGYPGGFQGMPGAPPSPGMPMAGQPPVAVPVQEGPPETMFSTTEPPAPRQNQATPPPYLASQTPDRMGAPQEPWAETLKTLMLVFGIAMVACFVLPWAISPEARFSWDALKDAKGAAKLGPLLIAGTGVLSVVLSLLPLTVQVRGIAAAALGFVPIALYGLVLGTFHWTVLLTLVGALTLVPGLLVRSEYHGAMLGRIMVTVGVACVLLPLIIPQGGAVPLVAMFKALGAAPGKMKVLAILEVLWFATTLLALLAWLPAPGAAGTKILAWLFIAKPLVDAVITTIITASPLGATIKAGLAPMFWLPITLMAWTALTGYGVASVAGKNLEHR